MKDARVSNSPTFNNLLLAAQQETRRESTEKVDLDVYLMNDQRVTISVHTVEQTDSVLEKTCIQLNIQEDLHSCFSLFLIRRDYDGEINIVRKLQDFESPYISQKALSIPNQDDAETGEPKSFSNSLFWNAMKDFLT